MMTEDETREAIVEEAKRWIGTPYHSNAAVLGSGIDCGMFLICVYSNVGVIEWFDPRPYPPMWAQHQKSERYLELVQKFSTEIEGPPKPADLVLFKFGNCWSHGGIVIEWPIIIHANPPKCRLDSWKQNLALHKRTPRFFSCWN